MKQSMRLLIALSLSILFVDSSAKTSFGIKAKGLLISYPVFSLSLLPDQALELEPISAALPEGYAVRVNGGELSMGRDGVWEWIAPSIPGLYPLTIINTVAGDSMTLNCFVMMPIGRKRNGYIGKYRIGTYPASGDPDHAPPAGFIEVTEENRDTPVSPHFTLGDFLPRESVPFPRYMPLKEELVLKLECIIEELNLRGIPCRHLTVMHGFRPPHQNSKNGNARFSRHIYGAAADIFVDNDRIGMIDDLNGDGKRNGADAKLLFSVIDEISKDPRYSHLDGGLGLYDGRMTRSPFVHVDVRQGNAVSWVSGTRRIPLAKAGAGQRTRD